MSEIILATLNARYIHTAFGLRYLKANLHEFESRSTILEFTIDQRPLDIAEQILAQNPKIIGFGVYIWNTVQTHETVSLIKRLAPHIPLILGGPEVSYEASMQPLCQLADQVVSGGGEAAFYAFCKAQLGEAKPSDGLPSPAPPALALDQLKLPYHLYTDTDIAQRILYVEASRGCPFKCEFCLSALDKTAKPFALDRFLAAMATLHERGARNFKFVDRTFNLNRKVSTSIMQFFLDRMSDDLFVHFEVIPDRLPDALKAIILQFPAGSIQLEVGVQTFNPEVQALISRKQDNAKSRANLHWLSQQSPAYIHTDLIFGLPGESMQSCGRNFDELVAIGPDEIQLGMLKRLRGMPMARLERSHGMCFSPNPPYEILSTAAISFTQMQSLRRFARYWDLIGNAGHFKSTLPLLLDGAPFDRFMRLSQWLHQTTGQTHKIGLKRLFDLLYEALTYEFKLPKQSVIQALQLDYQRSGSKGLPQCLLKQPSQHNARQGKRANQRQLTHLN